MRTEINGEKIALRRYQKSHAPLLYAAASESRGGEFMRWMPWCHENYSLSESESFIEHSLAAWERGTEYNFVILEAAAEEFLGGISINRFDRDHGFANLGYWVRVSRQHRGAASAATRLLARAAFTDLAINRIEIMAAVENEPSCKTAARSGAVREGVLRQRLAIGGRVHDAAVFSFVRADFFGQTP